MDENVPVPPPITPRRGRADVSFSDLSDPAVINAAPQRSRRARPGGGHNPWKSLQMVFSVALLVATLFTLWTPNNVFSNNMMERMFQAMSPSQPAPADAAGEGTAAAPAQQPLKPRIGLVAGHYGNDSGAVCPDGLTEASVNLKIASLVQEKLTNAGYQVDLLKEFDPRLSEYEAVALVSIHNDSCVYVGDQATGYKVAAAPSTIYPEKAMRLTACLSQRYNSITGMQFHYNTVTNDMTEYHAFGEIHSDTTAAIIETGFLNLDRDMLTNHTDLVAEGVASGILCFVRNEDIPAVPQTTP